LVILEQIGSLVIPHTLSELCISEDQKKSSRDRRLLPGPSCNRLAAIQNHIISMWFSLYSIFL